MDAYGIPQLQHVWAKVPPHMAHPGLKARHLGTKAPCFGPRLKFAAPWVQIFGAKEMMQLCC